MLIHYLSFPSLQISSVCHTVDDALSFSVDASVVSAYVSMERAPGASSYNIVVFAEGRGADDWG